jgi:aspartate/methionine/tyrosine aminotransferase
LQRNPSPTTYTLDTKKYTHARFAADLVHVVFGFSKDFAASGLRVGCLYSRNKQLLSALDNLGYFARQARSWGGGGLHDWV